MGRFVLPYQSVNDANFKALPGALLYFRDASTNKLKDTFTDKNLTAGKENTNPVVANDQGQFGDIFYEPGEYSVELTDKNGFTQPNYPANPVSDLGFDADLWSQAEAATRTSTTTFTISGIDQTTKYHAGRRVKLTGGSNVYGTVLSSAFVTDTTVMVVVDSGGSLNAAMTNAQVGPAVDLTSSQQQFYPPKSVENGVVNMQYQYGHIFRFMTGAEIKDYEDRTALLDISSALNNCHSSMPISGGTINYSAGKGRVDSAIVSTKHNVNIIGEGKGEYGTSATTTAGATELVTDKGIYIFDFGSASATIHGGPRIESIGFQDDSALQDKSLGAIRIRRMNHPHIINCGIKSFKKTGATGVLLDGTGDSIILPHILGTNIRSADIGIRTLSSVTGILVQGGFIANCAAIGIDIANTGAELLFYGAIDACPIGINLQSDGSVIRGRIEICAVGVTTSRNNNDIGGFYQNNTTDIELTGSQSGTIISNMVKPSGNPIITGTAQTQLNKFNLRHTGLIIGPQSSAGSLTTVNHIISAEATLDFPSTLTQEHSDLTITVNGAVVDDGNDVILGVPNASVPGACCGYWGFVSAADTVTIRFWNASTGTLNPANGTFRATVIKHL